MVVSIFDLRMALVLLVDDVTGETSIDPPRGLESLKDWGLVSSLRRSRKDLLLLESVFMDSGFSREELLDFLWDVLAPSRDESLKSSICVMMEAGILQSTSIAVTMVGVLGWEGSFPL